MRGSSSTSMTCSTLGCLSTSRTAMPSMSVSVPAALGPLAAGVVLDNYRPNLLWNLAAVFCAISASAFYALHVRLGAQPRFIPSAAGAAEQPQLAMAEQTR